jgi:dihydropyrimidine dehydrogenase (NAD+) subunit PreT
MSDPTSGVDIAAARLHPQRYADNFADAHPRLTQHQARVEADRCYFCYDAPCVTACPTGIDIPSFIRKIATGNVKGSAEDILDENILGAVCARVCPTEVLCESACVREAAETKPVAIGALQRYATDWLFDNDVQLFSHGAPTGKRVAVVGGGPAGLACAHRLALCGHAVTIFDARPKLGGLNEYGVAAYKVADGIADREVDYVLAVGGIDVRLNQALGRDIDLDQLRSDYHAVFLGLGLSGLHALGLDGEELDGVIAAVDYIAQLRQSGDLAALPVGRRVVVIGGGMTAIDVATQIKLLGADEVTIVYRRGPEHMGASRAEQAWAQTHGVTIRHWARPLRLLNVGHHACAVEFEATLLSDQGELIATDERFVLAADMVFKAIGQSFDAGPIAVAGDTPATRNGRLAVDADRKTSLRNVWAGGDCVAGGKDLTVAAVQDGKVAANAIDRHLRS